MTDKSINSEKNNDYMLLRTNIVLHGTILIVPGRNNLKQEILHNLTEFDEIILEKRREYHGKWFALFNLACGVFLLQEGSLPAWTSAPFFLLTVLIVIAWFKVGFHYLLLRKADKIVEYRLRDTPVLIKDFFEKMKANVLKVNPDVRFSLPQVRKEGE
ncbi:MAG: hypothetical protein ABIH42_05690 [Planctomycetota bacterium]